MNNEEYQVEEFDFPSEKEEQIQWIKELVNNQEATLFFKKRASNYNTTVTELQKLYFNQRGVCALCGGRLYFNEKSHIDHIVPKKLGGKNNIGNYQITCARCNYAKRDIPSREFIIMCIKIANKNKYLLSKTETIRVLDSIWKQQSTKEDVEKRKAWQTNYKERLVGNGKDNFTNILKDNDCEYVNGLFKQYSF